MSSVSRCSAHTPAGCLRCFISTMPKEGPKELQLWTDVVTRVQTVNGGVPSHTAGSDRTLPEVCGGNGLHYSLNWLDVTLQWMNDG
ncbi:hypothetical protein EPR50_G00030230 [Perca flavescens]|uniref:Uncharacterized protein n=1 Tax=Perca flavescens TaxID=8167 RepID=A0A484DIN5_PERFV|nr:hypothetical protein EPR50_G00030230 [Perca flavescens]